jgi:hypothetical protein
MADTPPKRPHSHKVGDDIAYRHGPAPDRMVEGYGRIISFGADGCWVESPDGRRCTVLHSAIVAPAEPDE